jgi:hypothetical protein
MYIHSLEFNEKPEIENIVVVVDKISEYEYIIEEINNVYYYVTI